MASMIDPDQLDTLGNFTRRLNDLLDEYELTLHPEFGGVQLPGEDFSVGNLAYVIDAEGHRVIGMTFGE